MYVYLSDKKGKTDGSAPAAPAAPAALGQNDVARHLHNIRFEYVYRKCSKARQSPAGTQFTSFTCTKVQIPTRQSQPGTQFTSFTGTA